MRLENCFYRRERQVGVMFMINGIKLTVFNKAKDMRKFHGYNPIPPKCNLESLYKIIDVRNVSQDIIPDKEISFLALLFQFFGKCRTEVLAYSGNTLEDSNIGGIFRRFNSEY